MLTVKAKVRLIQVVCALMLAYCPLAFAENTKSESPETAAVTSENKADSSEQKAPEAKGEVKKESKDDFHLADLWIWPFENLIQPFLNGLIYPLAKPIDYIFTHGVVDKSIDMITFGEKRNVLLYPSFNFKPGASTMLGANYRHRNLIFNKDYAVLQAAYFANGDIDLSARYSKHGLFGTPLFGAFRYDLKFDRDRSFIIPETKSSFTQPDSSQRFTWRLGLPLNNPATWNLAVQASLRLIDGSLPDVNDSILVSDKYPIADRGIYQKGVQVPLEVSVLYDNLDYPYAPSKGSRFSFTGIYGIVGDYHGLDETYVPVKSNKNHDYIRTELLFQHYFFLGSSKQYILSASEARKNRKFYTDFSWDEAIRIWKPENVFNTLFERRVIAFQFYMVDIWELEEGGAPYTAFVTVNARTPLRGYSDAWDTHHLMSMSWEYRWPVDRFVDGVLFNEYALIAPAFNKWSFKNLYNSWGVGIRVRQPNMYLFRIQFGFHGLHGVNLVMTIVPEFK